MYGNAPPPPPAGSSGPPGAPGSRYNYLVNRLRNRQITMEEATELFTVMQSMITRANEAARAAAARIPSAPAVPTAPVPEAPRLAPPSTSSDDLLLVGLLAMGAGAGLLAALSKRIGEAPGAPASSAPESKGKSTPS